MLSGKINYETLDIYKLSQEFVLHTYSITETFPESESNNLVSQLRRAATSVPLNIAEGSGAVSYRVFLNFLGYGGRNVLR